MTYRVSSELLSAIGGEEALLSSKYLDLNECSIMSDPKLIIEISSLLSTYNIEFSTDSYSAMEKGGPLIKNEDSIVVSNKIHQWLMNDKSVIKGLMFLNKIDAIRYIHPFSALSIDKVSYDAIDSLFYLVPDADIRMSAIVALSCKNVDSKDALSFLNQTKFNEEKVRVLVKNYDFKKSFPNIKSKSKLKDYMSNVLYGNAGYMFDLLSLWEGIAHEDSKSSRRLFVLKRGLVELLAKKKEGS